MSSITGMIAGIVITVTGATDGDVTARDVLNAGKVWYAVEQKTESGTWGASAHEESHQMLKDLIIEMGRQQ